MKLKIDGLTYLFKDCLEIPKKLELINNIKNIYDNQYQISNFLFYNDNDNFKDKQINDNSILFIESLGNEQLLNISKIINQNNKIIKVILIKENNINNNQSELVDFIEQNKIPIYELKNISKENDFIYYFLNNKKLEYINISTFIKNDNVNFRNNRYEDEQNNINIIHKFNNSYKFDFYLEIIKNNHKMDNNYNNIINEIINKYKIINIKLIKRLIYEIITSEYIEFSDIKNNIEEMKNIVYIYEVLCMEYYFNNSVNIYDIKLKKNLQKYLLKLLKKDEWLKLYFEHYMVINEENFINYKNYLLNFDISKKNNENRLINKYFNCFSDIIYDKLIFLSKNYTLTNDKINLIKTLFGVVVKIIENMKKNMYVGKFKALLLFQVLNTLYEYLINCNFNKDIIKLYEDLILCNKIHEIIKPIIENYIDLNDFFSKDFNNIDYIFEDDESIRTTRERRIARSLFERTELELNSDKYYKNENKKLIGNLSLFIEFIFIYFDICLILFFSDNKNRDIYDMFNYWIKSNNEIFKFYCDYKILFLEKYFKNNDYKSIIALILYSINIMEIVNVEKNEINIINDDLFIMEINKFNEYKISDKDFIYTLSFENINEDKNDNIEYNKLAIFSLDNNKNYYLQDIVDINEYKRFNNRYEFKTNKDLFFVPVKNIDTYICSFDYSRYINERTGICNSYYKNLKINENLPKYSWNFGNGNNYYIMISEEDNQIYTFNQDYLNKLDFIQDPKLNEINDKENKIINILESALDSYTFLSNQKNEIFCINNRNNIEYPFQIKFEEIYPKIKIKCISASNKSIYIIDTNGNLYKNDEYFKSISKNDIKWTKISLPNESNKFLQCACGDNHLICLIEDNKGKGKIYTIGENQKYQCGINLNKNIDVLTQCSEISHLNFKSVFANQDFSVAITMDNKLYIWGLLNKKDYIIIYG